METQGQPGVQFEPPRRRPWAGRRVRVAVAGTLLLCLVGAWIARARRPPRPEHPAVVVRPFPHGIVLHHSATGESYRGRRVDAALINEWHERRGFAGLAADGKTYHIGYHYVVLPDGSVEAGRPENVEGAHARLHNNTLGICLVGSFDRSDNRHGRKGPLTPSSSQLRSLHTLLLHLMRKYSITPGEVYLHRELVPTTECPGDEFPDVGIRAALFPLWSEIRQPWR